MIFDESELSAFVLCLAQINTNIIPYHLPIKFKFLANQLRYPSAIWPQMVYTGLQGWREGKREIITVPSPSQKKSSTLPSQVCSILMSGSCLPSLDVLFAPIYSVMALSFLQKSACRRTRHIYYLRRLSVRFS